MRKQTKLAVGISAAALLAVGASMTAFAARGWVAEGDQWYYYDNSGDYVTRKWKSYNGNYFYLGDDGYMLTNELVDDGNNYYYVDGNGAMVRNAWIPVPADDDEEQDVEYRWYYFGSNGKAYRDSDKKTINGKKYGFDETGKMLFGFVENRQVINDQDDPILSADHYYGSNDDGAMHTGWLLYQDALDATGYDDEYYWFWFNSSGKKQHDVVKKINGKKYSFDQYGAMHYSWVETTEGSASEGTLATSDKYYSNIDDGSLQKSSWIWSDGTDRTGDVQIVGDGDDHWWYTDKNGNLTKNQTKRINGKYYAFNDEGRMMWGLMFLNKNTVKNAEIEGYPGGELEDDGFDPENITADDIYNAELGENKGLFFFSGDEEKDGSMKTGTNIKIELKDDEYTFGFEKTKGAALNTIKNNKLYINGILQKAEDEKYAVYAGPDGEGVYLVSSSGTVMKSGNRTYKNDDDEYFFVASDGKVYTGTTASEAKTSTTEAEVNLWLGQSAKK